VTNNNGSEISQRSEISLDTGLGSDRVTQWKFWTGLGLQKSPICSTPVPCSWAGNTDSRELWVWHWVRRTAILRVSHAAFVSREVMRENIMMQGCQLVFLKPYFEILEFVTHPAFFNRKRPDKICIFLLCVFQLERLWLACWPWCDEWKSMFCLFLSCNICTTNLFWRGWSMTM